MKYSERVKLTKVNTTNFTFIAHTHTDRPTDRHMERQRDR